MKTLWSIARFNFEKVLAYPTELAAFVAGRLIGLGFLLIFWWAVAHSTGANFSAEYILAYFLVASSVRNLLLAQDFQMGKVLAKSIKLGHINNLLIKPIPVIPNFVATFVGENGHGFILDFILFSVGLILIVPGPINILALLLLLPISLIISIGINVFLGLLSFYFTEASGIRLGTIHIARILGGSLVPLYFFPDFWRGIALATPFPALAYLPAYLLQNKIVWSDLPTIFYAPILWSIIICLTVPILWRLALKKYEGVGI